MKVLLSIKPEFADKIFGGEKKYEFRKVLFKNPDVKTIVVYASSPVKRVVGEFDIDEILVASPRDIWSKTSEYSGISEQYFYSYFGNRDHACAIKIKSIRKFKRPRLLKENYNVDPPQSYVYLRY